MLALLKEYAGNTPAEFYLGDYGGFDSFAFEMVSRYMVERADLVTACVCRRRGRAYQTYRHALRKEKTLINMAEMG